MQRPPRRRDERLYSRDTIGIAVLQGLSILAVCLGVFVLARRAHSADAARALTFATLVVAFLVVILVNRSWTRSALSMLRVPNPALRWVLLGASLFLALALFVPFGQRLFHFAPLHATDLLLSLGAGLLCVLWFEGVKHRRRNPSAERPRKQSPNHDGSSETDASVLPVIVATPEDAKQRLRRAR